MTLTPGATGLVSPYTLAHERAHQAQQLHQTLLWRLHSHTPPWLPYLHRLTQVLVELECHHLAAKTLHHLGRYDQDAQTEGRRAVRHYLRALLWTP